MNRICNLDLKLKLEYFNTLRFIKKTDWHIPSLIYFTKYETIILDLLVI